VLAELVPTTNNLEYLLPPMSQSRVYEFAFQFYPGLSRTRAAPRTALVPRYGLGVRLVSTPGGSRWTALPSLDQNRSLPDSAPAVGFSSDSFWLLAYARATALRDGAFSFNESTLPERSSPLSSLICAASKGDPRPSISNRGAFRACYSFLP